MQLELKIEVFVCIASIICTDIFVFHEKMIISLMFISSYQVLPVPFAGVKVKNINRSKHEAYVIFKLMRSI